MLGAYGISFKSAYTETMTQQVVSMTPDTPSRMIAAELRAQLARRGLRQADVGAALGKPQAWVSRRLSLSGDHQFTIEEILEMANVLGLKPEDILRTVLPRLDSNQQPSGYQSPEVSDVEVMLGPDEGPLGRVLIFPGRA